MTCPHCAAAAQGPHYVFQRNCKACSARDIAAGPQFHRSRAEGRQVKEYRAQLEHYGVTHDQVQAAAKKRTTI
ncbi:hypothetical protein WDZ92_36685 [Nostoc sp. NIES-2111]